jgi:hypothetical protein
VSRGTNSIEQTPSDRPSTGRPSGGQASKHGGRHETAGERRLANLLIAGFILFVLGGALWLGDLLLQTRRMDDCVASGRRNCAPITAPSPPVR